MDDDWGEVGDYSEDDNRAGMTVGLEIRLGMRTRMGTGLPAFDTSLLQNSTKVMFKCLWKSCGKVLSSSSGMQKHIRTMHLG